MRVILTERVRSLGNVGEIVKVSAGFARNYLIPSKLAVLADKASRKVVEDQKSRLKKRMDAQLVEVVGCLVPLHLQRLLLPWKQKVFILRDVKL